MVDNQKFISVQVKGDVYTDMILGPQYFGIFVPDVLLFGLFEPEKNTRLEESINELI